MRLPRITISLMMTVILLIVLASAPDPITLRSPRTELIVATIAFEVILLPVIIALVVVARMSPSEVRSRIVVGLCLTPFIVYILAQVILGVADFVASYLWVQR